MLFQRWLIVFDAGPTFEQHCSNVSCLVGYSTLYVNPMLTQRYKQSASIGSTSVFICMSDTTNTRHQPNAVLMLAHRLRPWPNIEKALGKCLVFAGQLVLRLSCQHHRQWANVKLTLGKRKMLGYYGCYYDTTVTGSFNNNTVTRSFNNNTVTGSFQ